MTTRGLGAARPSCCPMARCSWRAVAIYPRMLDSAELYDPDTGSWTATAT